MVPVSQQQRPVARVDARGDVLRLDYLLVVLLDLLLLDECHCGAVVSFSSSASAAELNGGGLALSHATISIRRTGRGRFVAKSCGILKLQCDGSDELFPQSFQDSLTH